MSFADEGFHDILSHLANAGTGILWTNAAQLALRLNKTRKLMQHFLCRLERKGYIKKFSKARSRERYPILIDKYRCTVMPQKGMVLNAEKSTDWRNPVYEPLSSTLARPLATQLHKERARGEFRELRENTKVKSRPQPLRAPSTPPRRDEVEQRRIVEARDTRLQKEAQSRADAMIGRGPELPPDVGVCCIDCHAANPTHWDTPWEMGGNQFNRCLKGKPPRGAQSECPRHPKAVSPGTHFHRAAAAGQKSP